MQQVVIKTRICIMIGPTTSGKTTLAYKIQEMVDFPCVVISEDEIIQEVLENPKVEDMAMQVYFTFWDRVQKAIEEDFHFLIILDMLCIQAHRYVSLVEKLKKFGEEVTVLKLAIDSKIREQFLIQRLEEVDQNSFYGQDKIFRGKNGSLMAHVDGIEECVITTPEVLFSFEEEVVKRLSKSRL